MYMNARILYDVLKEKYAVRRYGCGVNDQTLSLPVFYERGATLLAGKVYLARTHDLPASPSVECLFVCVGSNPTNIWSSWRGEVLYIAESGIDILTAFNAVQEIFEKIINWECNMQALIENNADLEEMLKISIPIFENRITVTDYELRVLAYCEASVISDHKEVRLSKAYERVPNEKSKLFESMHRQLTQHKEPFIYKEYGIDQYCINLYLGDEYMGTCALMEDYRPLRESDYLLFQRFAGYIRSALSMQSRALDSQFVTLKTIFSELLRSLPVSRSDLNRVLNIARKDTGKQNAFDRGWICIVIRSANKGKSLPEGYLCTSLEDMLPNCSAIAHEGMIAAFCMLTNGADSCSDINDILEPYLKDMNFLAGTSVPFYDLFKARSYFLQACCALETGYALVQDRRIYRFEDFVLTYMLRHCCGQFDPELIFPPGLSRLRDFGGSVDYWDTLRRYLDNESNASRTAKEMFLHRSSLLPRLEKIKTFVDMDTPQQRLYLRICIYIYDLLDSKVNKN
jgi:hypothetical protein